MKELQDRITDRLRERICSICIYETSGGGCDLRKDIDCPILSRVGRIIEVVRQVEDSRIDPYVERLREVICADCKMQDDAGHCVMRDEPDCALNDYFPLVVEIVEEELGRESPPPPGIIDDIFPVVRMGFPDEHHVRAVTATFEYEDEKDLGGQSPTN